MMENIASKRLAGFGGLIAMTQSRKGTAFLVAVLIILVGRAYGDMDVETALTIATLAFGYIGGQSIVDSKSAVIEIEGVIDSVLPPMADRPSDPAYDDRTKEDPLG